MPLRILVTLLFVTLLAACGGGSSSSNNPTQTVQAAGTVVDDQGIPLTGAQVTVVSASAATGTRQTVQTDSSGRFSLTLDAATPAVVRVDKAGYTRGFSAAAAASDNASVASRVVLLPVASTQTFDPTNAAVLRVPGSTARVELAASSLVREDGQPISGTTSVALTPIDPSADIARMPGLMVDSASGEPIESLGALSIEFTDATGAPLNLASGQTATIRIPATPAAGATLPATFPLYHLNETTGRWTREGTGTLQTDPITGAQYYEGTVSHFSTWNSDRPFSSAYVDFGTTLAGETCTVPTGFRVESSGVDYIGSGSRVGNSVIARANSRMRVILVDANRMVLDTIEVSTGAFDGSTRVPRCLTAPPKVTLSGRVTLTSGQLSNYLVQISGERMVKTAVPIASDGSYSTLIYSNRGVVHARLVGYDRGTPDTQVNTTVASADASFPDLTVQDTRFDMAGCVQGWANYRQTSVQVSMFRGTAPIGQSKTLTASEPAFAYNNLPLNSTLTLRLTAPDATLVEKTTDIVVGNTPVTLGSCLTLPRAATAELLVSGTGLGRSFDASSSSAGDAAITGYAWDFGDGGTATGATASHSYAAAGNYMVSLTVKDALGQASLVRRTVVISTGSALSNLTPASALDAGTGHTCAVRAGGVWCWGDNFYQRLGSPIVVDTSTEPFTYTGLMSSGVPLQINGLSNVTAVSSGDSHNCVLHASGTVSCWGNGEYGQLGHGSRTDSATPVTVSGLATAVAVSAGGFETCALLLDGSVSCWGSGNTTVEKLVPAPVAGLGGVTALSVGYAHSCAVLTDGSVRCWGDNNNGQLGNGSTTDSSIPVVVSGISNAVSVVTGSSHSCALLADGSVRCWGFRGLSSGSVTVRSGLTGDGGTGITPALTPVTVSGISTASALATGASHTCALLQDASVWCWGGAATARGQADANNVALSPAQVSMTGAVNALALGVDYTCVSLTNGGVQCLGAGFQGRLGTGGQSSEQNPNPSPYPGFSITPLSVVFP